MKLTEPNRQWGISRGFGDGHDGIDYKYPENTPVTAAADGIVGFEGYGQNDPWTLAMGGIYVRIQHSDGSWTGYAHLSKTTVNKGQKVKAGQVIGYSGHTGQATGPHLHFEVIPAQQNWKNGYAARIDPTPFFIKPSPAKGGDMITRKGLEAVFLAYLGRLPDAGAYTHYVGNYTVDFVVDDVKKSDEYNTRQKTMAVQNKPKTQPISKSTVIDYLNKNLK